MNRFLVCLSASLLLSCAAAAQNLTSDPATNPTANNAPTADQPGVTSTVSPEVTQFQKIEDNRRDQYSLELVLSPLYVDVASTGDVTTRNQQVALAIGGEDKTVALTQKVI